MNLTNYILKTSALKAAPEIIFYGGSFNPWHAGHSSCVKMSPEEIPLIVIPDHNPRKIITSSLNNDQLIFKLMSELKFRVGSTFIYYTFYKLAKPNPTHKWVADLKENLPNKNFSLLMGHDSFLTIHDWINSKELLNNLTTIYIVSRLDIEEKKQKQKDTLLNIAPNLNIIFLGHHDFEELSSTKIREK
jgi:nicotinate-nucleotide adenylyltransferase